MRDTWGRGFLVHLEPREMVSFVKKDYDILASQFAMTRRAYSGRHHAILDRALISRGVRQSDFNISWFAYDNAWLTVRASIRYRRKSAIVLGGFDVCEEEDPTLRQRIPMVRYVLRNADRLFAVSNRVREKALALEPGACVQTVYHGFDSTVFTPGSGKQSLVTTVGFVKRANLARKGLEVFVRAAAEVPDARFLVVGAWYDESIETLRKIATPNVVFTGQVTDAELIRILQQSSVYVQASSHEGFGCSLAEAMLCECTPVASDRGALPEVVGDAGIIVDPASPASVATGIRQALHEPSIGRRARQRVARLFPIETRRTTLLRAITEMVS